MSANKNFRDGIGLERCLNSLILGRVRRGAFTSMIVFEIIWFRASNIVAIFLLADRLPVVIWVVWVGTAVDTIAGRAYYFPDGCIYTDCESLVAVTDFFHLLILITRSYN